jgi:predicted nucleotidyltransferase
VAKPKTTENLRSEEIARRACAIVRDELGDTYRVFLFGSRAEHTASERSDYDIGVEGSQQVPPDARRRILEAFEALPTLAKIELVDFATAGEDFRETALRTARDVAL